MFKLTAVLAALALIFGQLAMPTAANATVVPSPTIAGVQAAGGLGTGASGATVTITGTDFTGATAVRFAATAASFTVSSATSITATVPTGLTVGQVDVSVTTPTGLVVAKNAFKIQAAATAPTVTSVSPSAMGVAGNKRITVTGTNLLRTSAVTIGGQPAVSFTILSDTQIQAVVPASSIATSAPVQVVTPLGTSVTSPLASVSYLAPCDAGRLGTVRFNQGSSRLTKAGRAAVRDAASMIAAADCAEIKLVRYGKKIRSNTPAVERSYIKLKRDRAFEVLGLLTQRLALLGESTAISFAKLPNQVSQARAALDSRVGYRAVRIVSAETSEPRIIRAHPTSGPITGGTVVTLRGINMDDVTGVKFGTQDAVSFTKVSATVVTAISPARQVAGLSDISVVFATGSSTEARAFTFAAAPTITLLSATTSSLSGNERLVITGTNFLGVQGVTGVKFGTTDAVSYRVLSAESIEAIIPRGVSGAANVQVTAAGGSAASAFSFLGQPSVASVLTSGSLSEGPVNGGTAVTITGAGFTNAAGNSVVTSVRIGNTTLTSGFTVVNATSITLTTPANPQAVASVSVVTSGGEATLTEGFVFGPRITRTTNELSVTKDAAIDTSAAIGFTANQQFVGAITYTISGTLPVGLSIEGSTGKIIGTPTAVAARTSFTVTATGATSGVATAVIFITVVEPVS